jgi:integrase
MHNDYTLFTRKVPSGKHVVYYYAYDEDGKRLGPWTTGEASKTAARNHCNRLIRENKLIPGKSGMPSFEEYSLGWWEWESCPYLKDRRRRHNLTESYTDNSKKQMKNQLIPYFGKMKLNKITSEVIEVWFDYMAEKDYKNTYTNGIFGTLKTMMNWAVRKKILLADPTMGLERLANDRKAIKIISRDEFKGLFVKDWKKVWENNRIIYTANLLAALTGMRTSEVLGLRGEYVHDDHIYLCAQHDEYGYRATKTKDKHNIPVVKQVIAQLKDLGAMNGTGYLFSLDGGASPVSRKYLYRGYCEALRHIGITEEERAERGLCLHAWRHFCNTELHKAGLPTKQVQAVTGHKSERMSEWYCHFEPKEFEQVPRVQESLLGVNAAAEEKKRPDKKAGSAAKAKILKMPEREKKGKRARA